jgi:hypothetical protein
MANRYVVLLLLTSCAGPIGVDKNLSAEERDRLQREMPRPEPDDSSSYVVAEVDVEAGAPAPEKLADLTALLRCPVAVAVPERVDPLSGTWPQPGARRRIVFADGNSVVEEMLEPRAGETYRYVAWNLTTNTGRYVRYAVGVVSQEAGHLRWSHAYRPKAWPDGWIIEGYVHEDLQPCMRAALTELVSAQSEQRPPAQ